MLVPTLPSSGGSAPSPGGGFMRRRFLGASRILSSGAWNKAEFLAAPYFAGIPTAALEHEIECVGAGGGGTQFRNAAGYGATPGSIAVDSFLSDDLPDSVAVAIGAGGPPGSAGGWTTFGDLIQASGGITQGGGLTYPATERPVGTAVISGQAHGARGPGAGGSVYYNPIWQTYGGASNLYRPRHFRDGGVNGSDGLDARDHLEYGSGGGGSSDGNMMRGGNGGSPGGGGGAAAYGTPGTGGRGEVRIRSFVWEAVQ